MLTTQKKVS